MFKTILTDVLRRGATQQNQEIRATHESPLAPNRLHLGCGANILDGWLNVDVEPGAGVLVLDLRQPLPFADLSIDLIFNEHFIEHIERHEALALLRECRRVLKAKGTLRISTPSLTKLIEEYEAGRVTEWTNVGWLPRTPCQLLNEGMRLWGHRFLYDIPEFEALLSEAGFETIVRVAWRRSTDPRLCDLECRPFHSEIIVEASA